MSFRLLKCKKVGLYVLSLVSYVSLVSLFARYAC